MAVDGPYLAHMCERYGVVIGLYGTDMVANHVKIEAMVKCMGFKAEVDL